METVLLVGATGNIGVSVVKAALRSKRNVLAVVRSQESAEKLIKHVGTSEGISFTEANVVSESGIRGVVEQVRAGKLPAFQHVFSCVGPEYIPLPLKDITLGQLERNMGSGFQANFLAYRETIGYLLEQKNSATTWTLCTGSQGDLAIYPLPGMTQGPLYSMATAACRENENTSVRFNEIYLTFRVEVDDDAKQHRVTSATEFSHVYEQLLARSDIRSARVRVDSTDDIKTLKYQRKF